MCDLKNLKRFELIKINPCKDLTFFFCFLTIRGMHKYYFTLSAVKNNRQITIFEG